MKFRNMIQQHLSIVEFLVAMSARGFHLSDRCVDFSPERELIHAFFALVYDPLSRSAQFRIEDEVVSPREMAFASRAAENIDQFGQFGIRVGTLYSYR